MIVRQSITLLVLTSTSPLCLAWSSHDSQDLPSRPVASTQSISRITANTSQNLAIKIVRKQRKNTVDPKPKCLSNCLSSDKIGSKANSNLFIQKTFSFPRLVAQTSPSIPSGIVEPTQPASQQLPESFETQSIPTLNPLLNSPQTVPFQPDSLPQERIPVKQVEVLGSTAFSSEELDEVIAPFINQALTFEELLAIRTALTELYTSNGYITSGAFLPPQDTANGIVKIQVVEGKLEDVEIQGLKRNGTKLR